LSPIDLFKWKRNLKIRKGPWAIFSAPAQLCTDLRPTPACEASPLPCMRLSCLRSGPTRQPSLPPIPLLCSARVATEAELPPTSRPPITTSTPQCSHLCTHTLEPSHHSLILYGITSALRLLTLPLSLRQPGMLLQGLDDEALEQAASLAKLQLPKASRAGRRLALPARVHSRVGRVH
jgi:hypothetical protein